MSEDKKLQDHQIQISGLNDLFKEAEASVDKYAPEKEAAEVIPSGAAEEADTDNEDPANWDMEKMDLEAIEVVNGPDGSSEPIQGEPAEPEGESVEAAAEVQKKSVEPAPDTREEPTKNERAPQAKEPEEPKGPSPEEAVMQAMLKEKNRMVLAISRLEQEKKDSRQEKDQYKDSLVRVAANFDNFKKRVSRDKDEVYKYAQDEVLKVLFDVADNLERATQIDLTEAQENERALAQKVLDGVNMTFKSVNAALNKLEVTAFSALDSFFDPNFHEAVQRLDNENVPEGWVVEEYCKGYLQGERLIRAAMVVVAAGGISRKEWEATNLPQEPEHTSNDTAEGEAVGDTSESQGTSSEDSSQSSQASSEEGDGTEESGEGAHSAVGSGEASDSGKEKQKDSDSGEAESLEDADTASGEVSEGETGKGSGSQQEEEGTP